MSNGSVTKITAPMVGKIMKVNVKPGDKVIQNQTIITFESMKIEMQIMAPVTGVAKEVLVNAGQTITAEQPLVTIES